MTAIGNPGRLRNTRTVYSLWIPTKDVRFNAVDTSVQQKLKPTIPKPEDFQLWETCMTINNTGLTTYTDRDFKSAQSLIRALVEVAKPRR